MIIVFFLGLILGMLIIGILSAAKQGDKFVYEYELELLVGKLRDEEERCKLLEQANEQLQDEKNELQKKYEEVYQRLDAMLARNVRLKVG